MDPEEPPPPRALRSFWPYLATRRRPPLTAPQWVAVVLAVALAAAVGVRVAEQGGFRVRAPVAPLQGTDR